MMIQGIKCHRTVYTHTHTHTHTHTRMQERNKEKEMRAKTSEIQVRSIVEFNVLCQCQFASFDNQLQ